MPITVPRLLAAFIFLTSVLAIIDIDENLIKNPVQKGRARRLTLGSGIRSNFRDSKGRYKVRTCSMHLQADHTLYTEIYENEGSNNPKKTREVIEEIFHSYIQAINDIYRRTNFNSVREINFAVKKISICDRDWCSQIDRRTQDYVDGFLYSDEFSLKNHSSFCLSYVFTYSELVDILGLAWMAQPHHRPFLLGVMTEGLNAFSMKICTHGRMTYSGFRLAQRRVPKKWILVYRRARDSFKGSKGSLPQFLMIPEV